MIHEILPVGPLACNCSLIGDEATREAMVIDPGDEVDEIMAIVRRHGLTVKQIVVTHGHIDHVGGAMKLKRLTSAPILLNQNDFDLLKTADQVAAWLGMTPPGKIDVDQDLSEGNLVGVGNLKAVVMHTPGHTEGSVCLHFAPQQKLIAGDTLFAGSIGRTDLPGGNFKKIIHSLKGPVMSLPDETVVIPGHGPTTTIGEERETNPFIIGRYSE